MRPGDSVERFTNSNSAVVRLADGKKALAESTEPVATNDHGKLAPIDEHLVDTGSDYAPRRGAIATHIAHTAGGGFSLGSTGVTVRPLEAGNSPASTVNGKLFYPNNAQNSDLILESKPTGIETYEQIRSSDSPEDYSYHLDLPPGAEIRPLIRADGFPGGAEVVQNGKAIVGIDPPVATDAAGVAVPTTYRLNGNTLTLHVAHREGSYQYPLLADPPYSVVEYDDPLTSTWNWWGTQSSGSLYSFSSWTDGYSGHVQVNQNPGYYNVWQLAEWFWNPMPNTYVYRADFNSQWSNSPNQCLFDGIYSWATNGWDNGGQAAGVICGAVSNNYMSICSSTSCDPMQGNPPSAPAFGLYAPSSGYYGGAADWLDGEVMYYRDRIPPSTPTLSGGIPPDGPWIDTWQGTTTVKASDVGVGMWELQLDDQFPNTPGQPPQRTWFYDRPCSRQTPGAACPVSPDLLTNSFNWSIDSSWPNGRHIMSAVAADAAANGTQSALYYFNVDHGSLALASGSPSGSLWDARGGTITSDSAVSATVNDPYSGVGTLEVDVDGTRQTNPPPQNPNPCNGCSLSVSYTLPINQFREGQHQIAIVASDEAGHTQTMASWSVTIQRIDMGQLHDNYGYDWQGIDANQDLEVNVANGNAIIRSRDLNFAENQIDLPFERYINTLWLGHKGSFGWGQTATVGADMRLTTTGGVPQLVLGDGTTVSSSQQDDGTYTASASDIDMTFVGSSDGSWNVTDNDSGNIYHFVSGQVQTITDPNGASVTLAYAPDGSLSSVSDSVTGKTTTFGPRDASGDITQIQQDAQTYQYQYGGADGRSLASFTDPQGHITSYKYDTSSRLTEVDPPDGTVWRLAYDTANRIASLQHVTDLTGNTGPTTTYAYSPGSTVVTEPDGQQITYTFGSDGLLTGTSANPLPADYQACLDMQGNGLDDPTQAAVYCELNNRDIEVISPDGPVYDPTPPTLGNVTNYSDCYAEFSATDPGCARGTAPQELPSVTDAAGPHPYSIGIADDSRILDFNNPSAQPDGASNEDTKWFKDLNTNFVRAIVPYNIYYDHRVYEKYTNSSGQTVTVTRRGAFSRWYHRAVANGLQVMVSFECKLNKQQHCTRHIPSRPEYHNDVRKFMGTYPGVQTYSAWNEPNSQRGVRFTVKARHHGKGPERAAVYTGILQKSCEASQDRGQNCTVVAADMTDRTPNAPTGNGGVKSNDAYEQRYKAKLKAFDDDARLPMPVVWALHPYIDLNRASNPTSSNVNSGSSPLDTQAFISNAPAGSQIWFSEIGAWYEGTTPGYQQADRTAYLFATLANMSSRIERVNYYNFYDSAQTPGADSHLITPGTNYNPRSADQQPARRAYWQVGCRSNPGDSAHYPTGCPTQLQSYTPQGATGP